MVEVHGAHAFLAVRPIDDLGERLDGGVREEVNDTNLLAQICLHLLHKLRSEEGVAADVEEGVVLHVDLPHLHDVAPNRVQLALHLRLGRRAIVHSGAASLPAGDGACRKVHLREGFLVQLSRDLVRGEGWEVHQKGRDHVMRQLLLQGQSDLQRRGLGFEHQVGNHELVLSFLALHVHDAGGDEVGQGHDHGFNGPELHRVASHLYHGVASTQDLQLTRGKDASAISSLVHPSPLDCWESLVRKLLQAHVTFRQCHSRHVELSLVAERFRVQVFVQNVGLDALDELSDGAILAPREDAAFQVDAGDVVALADAVEIEDLRFWQDFLDSLVQGDSHHLAAKSEHLHGLEALDQNFLWDGLRVQHCFQQAWRVELPGDVHLLDKLGQSRRIVDHIVGNDAENLPTKQWSKHLPNEENVGALNLLFLRVVGKGLVAPLV
mmetsp:Transcript_88658/g.185283  ORF Transcript_88658/g.185283 Transcript_88658/m.185283 type:complete len:437 (+) Transcript_88658:2394-3704(+)